MSESESNDKPKAGLGPRARWVLVGAVCLLIAGMIAYLGRPTPRPADETPEEMDEELVVRNPGYVGIEVCAECHADRTDAVRKTRHALACRPASVGAAAPGFAPGRGLSESSVTGVRFEMSHIGDDFRAVGIHSGPDGEERRHYEIGLVYGSAGKRDEMYFSWEGNRLSHLPVAWLYPYGRWGHGIDSIQAQPTPPSCLECHNTWVGHVPGTANVYQRDGMILGVTCERCHGPGQEHVVHHRKVPNDAARSILHPGTLSRERLMDVCGQCHGNTRPTGRVFSYRPGEPLDAHFRTVKVLHPEEGTTDQVGFLQTSKCFQKSEMTCITCHDPHRTKPAAGKCVQCHSAADCREQPRLPAEVRPNCVGCHMPERIWMHVHFYTTSDDRYLPIAPRAEHRIGVYPDARDVVLAGWLRRQPDPASRAEGDRLARRVADQWIREADQRRDAGRFKGAIGAYREALKLDPLPATRQRMLEVIQRQSEVDELIRTASGESRAKPDDVLNSLNKLIAIKPDLAFAHGQLGTIHGSKGRRAEAVLHLNEVVKCDPNDNQGAILLAQLALEEGRAEDAVALCAEAYRIDAGHAGTHHLWGQALAKLERWNEAELQYRKTLAISPGHGRANRGLSESLLHQGQVAEAVRYGRRAEHWGGRNNIDVLLTLADAYVAADRTDDARNALERAMAIAQSTNSPSLPAIRERLRKL